MTKYFADMIYLIFSCRLMIKAHDDGLKTDLIQAQLDEAKHQLTLALIKSQKGFHHGF